VTSQKMGKPRRWTDSNLRYEFPLATSVTDLIRRLGMSPSGGTHAAIIEHCNRLQLDASILLVKKSTNAINDDMWVAQHMRVGHLVRGVLIRERLARAGLLDEKCYVCGITEWLGHPAPLHVDHINGVHDDNRIENIRLLCANCHGLTETWGNRKTEKRRYHCPTCGAERVSKPSTVRCRDCYVRPTKIAWPSRRTLHTRVTRSSLRQVSRELGVSDTALRNRLARHN